MATIELLSPAALRVIQEMALGMICTDCEDGYSCPHCSAKDGFADDLFRKDVPELEELPHDADCPVVLARRFLAERGTPLHIYQMSCEERWGQKWHSSSGYTLALTAEEAIARWTRPTCRAVRATFVRPLPLDTKE